MLCQAILQEHEKRKGCWLPADPSSYFHFCRRCHFNRISELLDSMRCAYQKGEIPTEEYLLSEHFFLDEALHKSREQAFLSLLGILCMRNRPLLHQILDYVQQSTTFGPMIKTKLLQHGTGPRCALYRTILRHSHLTPSGSAFMLDGLCWDCVVWLFRQRDMPQYSRFVERMVMSFHTMSPILIREIGVSPFLDMIQSLYINDKPIVGHALWATVILFLEEEQLKTHVLRFYSTPPFLSDAIAKKFDALLPAQLDIPSFREEIEAHAKKALKDRLAIIEEELITRTWHPDRVVAWCVDPIALHRFAHRT